MNRFSFALLTALSSALLVQTSCMKKEIDPVPKAQVPYECYGNTYFQRLYPALSSAYIFPTADGHLLMFDQHYKFIKTDTSGNILWAKQIANYGNVDVFRRRADDRFYAQTKTNTSFNLTIYDDELNTLHNAAFNATSGYNVFAARDSFSVVSVNAVASKSNLRKLAVSWLDADLNTRWTYQEVTGYNYMLDMDEDEQFIYLGGSQYNFDEQTGIINGGKAYVVKLNKADGHALWAKTFSLSDLAFTNVDSIAVLSNGNFQMGGVAFRGAKNERVYILLEADASGNILSRKEITSPSSPYVEKPIEAFSNNRHLVIKNQPGSIDLSEIQAIMYDRAGVEIWRAQFGGEGAQYAHSAVILPSGNIIISGTTSYYNGTGHTPENKMLLIKCDASGNTCY